jgi:hypothetical protein
MGAKPNLRILRVALHPETPFWATLSEPLFLLCGELSLTFSRVPEAHPVDLPSLLQLASVHCQSEEKLMAHC